MTEAENNTAYRRLSVPEHEETVREKGSRFIATAMTAGDMDQASSCLDSVRRKYPDATHHCYAYVLTDGTERAADDGEPSGTAGKPILNAIVSRDFNNTVVVVTRYYGGTKLGIGGLKRAYVKAAGQCLDSAPSEMKIPVTAVTFEFPYSMTGEVERALKTFGARKLNEKFSETCCFTVEIELKKREELCAALTDCTSGQLVFSAPN